MNRCILKSFLAVCLLCITGLSFAQENPTAEADQAYRQGDFERALSVYLRYFQKTPQPEKFYLDMASLYKEMGRYQDAIGVLEYYLDAGGGENREDPSIETWRFLGELYYLIGDEQRALSLFNWLSTSGENRGETFFYLGLIHEALGDSSVSIQYYKRAFKIDPSAAISYRLAKYLYREGDWAGAIRYFLKTIRLDSSIRPAYYFLSDCLLRRNDYEQAYRYLPKAISFYPQDKALKKKLRMVKKKLGDDFFAKRKKDQETERKEVALRCDDLGDDTAMRVKVGVVKAAKVTFKCGGSFSLSDGHTRREGNPGVFYILTAREGGGVSFSAGEGSIESVFTLPLEIKAKGCPFYILDITHGTGSFSPQTIDTIYRGDLEIRNDAGLLSIINVLSMEKYLYGVISAEILASSHPEALKAQAVAARTYAMSNLKRHRRAGYDFCSTTHCQVYRGVSAETSPTTAAVDATRGEVLLFGDEPISAFFHSNCGGCIRGDIFGQQPYFQRNILDKSRQAFGDNPWWYQRWFKSNDERLCGFNQGRHCRWQRTYDRDDFYLEFGFPLQELERIISVQKGDCGHLKEIKIKTGAFEKNIEGDLPIRNFFGHLKSSAFLYEIKYGSQHGRRVPKMLFLWGAGFGHGVGMSQEGVMHMARQGYTYREILKKYYRDVRLEKTY